ncbi:MAG TPA: translation elongation factor Ts [Roseiflexaceae bacterium]|nr:translation elongation factor Ts [Roseiflexaceae bacterium]HMP39767.1 translation elongation factor Ts [Roseiflexaceae bacterium]
MAEITAQMVKELRERTGAGVKDCKDILTQAEGNMDKAIEIVRERGLKVSDKVQGREAREGRIEIYVHPGAKMATMVEINCETDFVARTEEFIQLSKDLALHIAALNPRYIRSDEVPAEEVTASGLKPEKYYEEVVLLAQPFVKDPSQTIEDKIKAAVAQLRENVVVRRYTRYEVGN